MQKLLIGAVLLLVILAAAWLRPGGDPSPPPSPGPRAAPTHGAWWPLEPGASWEYRVVRGEPGFTRRDYQVRRGRGEDVRVFERTDGKQSDDFLTHPGEGGEVRYKEFQAASTEVLYLPRNLGPEVEWHLKPNLRARAVELEEQEVPAFPGTPLQALRIEYETFYSEEETTSPGWYAEGVRWFAPGVGMVREDLTAMAGPPEAEELVRKNRRELVLERYRPGGSPPPGP